MTWRKGNRLKMVPESQAEGEVAAIYRDMKAVLGTPHVDGTYQALAAFPLFLSLHWNAIRPVVCTQEFFDLAERMRADCYTRMHGYFDLPNQLAQVDRMGLTTNAQEQLVGVVDLHNYFSPVLLLMLAAQFQAFDSPVGDEGRTTRPAERPEFVQELVLVPEDNAPAAVRRCYEEIKRSIGLPFVPSFYLSLARWPEFLQAFWDTLRPIVRSPVYEGCHYGSRETAFSLVREFPEPVDLNISQLSEAGTDDDDIASIVRIVELFITALSATVLNVAAAKIGLEGGTRLGPGTQKPQPSGAKTGTERAA